MELYQRVRVKNALRSLQEIMGRPCKIIDSALLAEKVMVIIYKVAPYKHDEFKDSFQHQLRIATFHGQIKISDTIIRSWFSDSEEM